MGFKSFLSIVSGTLLAFCSASNCLANSEELLEKTSGSGFFTRGAVSDMSIPLQEQAAPEIQYGPTKGFKVQKAAETKPESPNANPDQNKVVQQPAEDNQIPPPGVDAQEFRLKKEFGDPAKPYPVKGVDSAPTPYKAMLEAINMGRDDLALQYANQWMAYMKDLDRVVNKATAMAKVVKMDPMAGEDKLSESAISNIDPKALSDYFRSRRQQLEESSQVASVVISDQSRTAINAVFGDSDEQQVPKTEGHQADPYARLVDSSVDAESRKMLIRATLEGKLPQDPSGNVQLMFFVDPADRMSIEIGKEISKVLSSPTLDVSLSVVPLSVKGVEFNGSSKFFNKTGIPAVLRDGAALSKSLNISEYPSLLFVTDKSEQAFLKTGKADAVFIEEVSRMIGGK